MTAATQNFHVPLADDLHRELRTAAKAAGRHATDLARELISSGLARLRNERIALELSTYVAEMAETDDDLDPALEAAGVDQVRRTD